jgi:UDP-N-acetylmuramoyl-tripeptide--D-alanyl-D-alanine ligase
MQAKIQPTWNDCRRWIEKHITNWQDQLSDFHPHKICIDSRAIKAGDIFVAIKGESFDGHQFIASAIAKGASAFIYAESAHEKLNNISETERKLGIGVKDTLAALQAIGLGWREMLNPKHVIALTGSVGKTTAKEMIAAICESAGATHYSRGSFNNEIGVPLTLLKLSEEHQYVVLEFGARHEHDIGFLCSIARPNVAACLNAKAVHLSEFGSLEKVVKTKTEIFLDSDAHATLIAPADDRTVLENARKTGKTHHYIFVAR